jgi:recombination protein RecA
MVKKKEKIEADGEQPLFAQDEGRMKALEAALQDLTKRFGDGTIIRLGDAVHLVVDAIPTGSLGVDISIGVGGIPRGRITEIYGPESSGKTTLCLHVIAEAQKRGGLCAFIDMEHALDPAYAARVGVNMDTLYVAQPDTGENALEITEALVRSGALDVIVIDSVAALVPRAEIEGEMGDSHVGLQARLMSQALRKLSGAIKQSNVSVLFTNQIREKVGVMYGCFDHDTQVVLADGTTEKIGHIVNQKMDVEVLSYDVKTHQFEPRRILNWFDNGLTDTFLEFTVEGQDDIHHFACTPNHLLLTEEGYTPAEELAVGEKVLTAVPAMEMALAGDTCNESTLPTYRPNGMSILDIQVISPLGNNHRYDLEVEGNHCYVVDGVVVHNSPETQPGGRALKFYASVRLDIRRVEGIKVGGDTVGNRTRVRVTKNKVAAPFRETEFDIMFYENGISKTGEIIDLGVELGMIEKRGAFFRYNDGLLGQGRENAKQFLADNKAVSDEIEDAIRAHFGLPTIVAPPPAQ